MDQKLSKGSQKKSLDDHVCQKWDILELQNDYGKDRCPMSPEKLLNDETGWKGAP